MLAAVACLAAAGCTARSSFASVASRPHATPSATSPHPTPRPTLSPGAHKIHTAGGRTFTLVVPPHLRDRAALVVALGGLGWTADKTRQLMRLDGVAASEGALVAFPSAPGGLWNAGDCCRGATQNDITYLRQLRQAVQARAVIDPARTLLLGFSNGGMLAYHAACNDSGWSAIAVLGATLTADCRTRHPFAITNVNGRLDTVVHWNGGYAHYVAHTMPAVWVIDRSFARLFHCGPARTTTRSIGTFRTYSGCQGGVTIRDIRVPHLKHHWPLREIDHYDMGPRLWRLAIG